MDESGEERRHRELILHCPQHAGEGVSQTENDKLFD